MNAHPPPTPHGIWDIVRSVICLISPEKLFRLSLFICGAITILKLEGPHEANIRLYAVVSMFVMILGVEVIEVLCSKVTGKRHSKLEKNRKEKKQEEVAADEKDSQNEDRIGPG